MYGETWVFINNEGEGRTAEGANAEAVAASEAYEYDVAEGAFEDTGEFIGGGGFEIFTDRVD